MTLRHLGQIGLALCLLAAPAAGQAPSDGAATNTAPSPASLIDDLKIRAAKGDADAEQKLGRAYHDGQLVPQDDAQAFAWALKAAQQGNTLAAFNVSFMYSNGIGTKKDPAAAFQWNLALAKKGIARAQYLTGSSYIQGIGTTKDPAQAFAWLQKAALQGDAPSENDLGVCYEQGFGVAKDTNLAIDWFTKSATQGFGAAQLALGKIYFYGYGTAKDETQGVAWFEKAAIQGNTEARTLLGVACLRGIGTPVDLKKGFTYLLNSSLTDGYATYWIAWCYSSGTFVARDPVQAYAWGLRASTMTSRDDVTKFLADLKPTLTADQIAEAQKSVPDLDLLLHSLVQPADAGTTFANGKSSLIPFLSATGEILIPIVTQDGSRAYLMFDTGASISFLSQAYATKAGLKGNSYIPISGIGQNLDLGMISDQSDFALPGMTFKNVRWAVGTHLVFDTDMGQPIVGVLGLDILKTLVVRIDYHEHTIEFINHDGFATGPSDGSAFPLTLEQTGAHVRGTAIQDGVEATGSFIIDTGNNGSIGLTKDFQDQNPSLKPRRIVSGAASGIGGNSYETVGSCSTFILGNFVLPNPELDLDQNRQGLAAGESGAIGNEIWRRFNVCLDFPDKKIFLQKNAQFDDPYRYATAGIHITAAAPDYSVLTVREMLPGGDAERAGFQAGDVITKVDELGQNPLRLENVYPLCHTPGTYHFLVRRKDQAVPLVLEVKDPLAAVSTAPTRDPNASAKP